MLEDKFLEMECISGASTGEELPGPELESSAVGPIGEVSGDLNPKNLTDY